MPKPIKKRIPKKMEVPEEEVREKLSSLRHTLQERQRIALKIAIAVVVVVIIGLSSLVYSRSSTTKAKQLEYEAYMVFHGVSALPQQSEDRYKQARDMFKKAYATKKSPLSLYYIAACSYELGDYDESLKTLGEFVRTYPGEEEFLPLAYRKMVTIYLKKNDLGEAKKALDALYALRGDAYKDYALYEYGRILEKEEKLSEARKKYEELITRFPSSPYKDEVRTKMSAEKNG